LAAEGRVGGASAHGPRPAWTHTVPPPPPETIAKHTYTQTQHKSLKEKPRDLQTHTNLLAGTQNKTERETVRYWLGNSSYHWL